MSAVPRDLRLLEPMTIASLDAVLGVERAAYEFPWTRGNFIDALAAGYWAQRLLDDAGRLLGYVVAMHGVDEMHLLNITVAPPHQHAGHARWLLDVLVEHCRALGDRQLWLEVRAGNARAHAIYRRYGFRDIGIRKGYYPAAHQQREDARVMSLAIAQEGDDALG